MKGGEIFVPKIPSMSVMDLAKAIAPNCKYKHVGIRPGEKIHETLLTEDEARRSLEFKDLFVVEPNFPWWQNIHKGGKRPKEGFAYSSDSNKQWLSGKQLQKMIK